MVEFNPDGSLKLSEGFIRGRREKEQKLKTQKCIKIKKEVVSYRSPKKCVLNIILSEAIKDRRFLQNIYEFFASRASTPTKIKQIGEREYQVEIGTDFRRCSDCNSLVSRYREFLHGNVIEDKGTCTYKGRSREFCYEDYFD